MRRGKRTSEWISSFQPPGTAAPPRIPVESAHLLEFESNGVTIDRRYRLTGPNSESLLPPCDSGGIQWIHHEGLSPSPATDTIFRQLGIEPLVQEDLFSLGHRPKVSVFDETGGILGIIPTIRWKEKIGRTELGRIGMILGNGRVVTFAEEGDPIVEAIRERVRSGHGLVRGMPMEYLLYLVLDAAVDEASQVNSTLLDETEEIEEEILSGADTAGILRRIHDLRVDTVVARRRFEALRTALIATVHGRSPVWGEQLTPYLGDLMDHVEMVVDGFELRRDQISALVPLHSAVTGTRMNEVMKTLTIIATIFIPLTFLAGIYGMNFVHMPELAWPWAYPTLLGLMGAIVVAMIAIFRKKRWF